MRHLPRALLFAIGLALSFQAFAFDGLTDSYGSHMETTRTELHEVFGAEFSVPVKASSVAGYGITYYRYPSYKAADLMSEASRDIDLWYFGPLYPHAMTPEFNYGRDYSEEELESIELNALWDYLKHMSTWTERVRGLYRSGDGRDATYLLGVLVHSYEDLWAHHGITDAMHLAYRPVAGRDLDVDHDPARIAEERRRVAAWFAKLPALLGDQGHAFTAYLGSGAEVKPLSVAERNKLFGRRRDIFVQGIIFKFFTRSDAKCLRYRQAIEWDLNPLDEILGDRAAYDAILAMRDKAELKAFLLSRGYRF